MGGFKAWAAAVVFLSLLYCYSVPNRARPTQTASLSEYLRAGMHETEHYRFAEGMRWLEAARRLAPQSADVHIALGKHYFLRRDYVRSIDEFVLAARYTSGNSEILYYAGLLRQQLAMGGGRPQGTLIFFERAYQMDEGNYAAMRSAVWLVAQTKGKAEAQAMVQRRLRAEPRNANLWWVLGEAHAAVGDFAGAIAPYRHALSLDPKLAPAKLAYAEALKRTGHPDGAVSQFWLGAMIDAKYTVGFYLAAQTLLEMKDVVQAESMVRYLIQIAPDYPGAYRLLATIYRAGGRHDLAVEAMAQESQHHPEDLSARVDLAEAMISVGRFEPAIGVLKSVTTTSVDSIREPRFIADWVRGHVVLSKAYRGLRRYDAAEEAARVASRFDSQSLYVQREMAYVKAGLDFGN